MLEPEEIRDLLFLVDNITTWQALIESPPEALAAQLQGEGAEPIARGGTVGRLARSLRSRLNPDGSLSDDASPDLRRIRREIERQQRVIEESLRSTLRRLSEGGSTQEDLITIRGERFVIPVKAEYKRRIPGVVHGASSSGQTVYLEPLETIEQNNELVRLIEEEQAETRRIFLAMTREIGRQSKPSPRAPPPWPKSMGCRRERALQLSSIASAPASPTRAAPVLELKQARHPLLEKRLRARQAAVVPLTLALNDQQRQLIISGPNTGGKTVALKTAGLLGMMAQAGIPVPAARRAFPCSTRFWPTSATRSRSSRTSPPSPRTSSTWNAFRSWRMRLRWCCSMSWARPPTRKRVRRWRWPSPAISSIACLVPHLHPSHLAEGLRGQATGGAQRVGGL